ncbi:phosphoglucosamine mutase [bacterium 3DAC]|nr:phosphoglucosamine mutase [bacterium 3DAC]
MKWFGTDGIRGIFGEDLTPDIAFKLGVGVARYFSKGSKPTIMIAKDPRLSSDALEASLISGILSAGGDTITLGILPTPGLALLASLNKEVNGAVMISASHNPIEYNGLKVFNGKGEKLEPTAEEEIEHLMEIPLSASWDKVGSNILYPEATKSYIDILFDRIGDIDLKEEFILVDTAHGATCNAAVYALQKGGARVNALFGYPDGWWINNKCGATHPEVVAKETVNLGAAYGFTFDGDGDRVFMVMSDGMVLTGDHLLAVLAYYLKEKGLLGQYVVSTIMANLGLEAFLRDMGITLIRTPVGDKYVYDEMKKTGAILGGESSGHIILMPVNNTGDGIGIMLYILHAIYSDGLDIEEVLRNFTLYPSRMYNLKTKYKHELANHPKVKEIVNKYTTEYDGIARIIVRPSGTEHVLRISVEAQNNELVVKLLEAIVSEIQDVENSLRS